VTPKEAIAALRARIEAAESGRDAWRASGMRKRYLEARYLEACSRCEALELQLARLREEGLRFSQTRAEDP
jgi:hypothetical protein